MQVKETKYVNVRDNKDINKNLNPDSELEFINKDKYNSDSDINTSDTLNKIGLKLFKKSALVKNNKINNIYNSTKFINIANTNKYYVLFVKQMPDYYKYITYKLLLIAFYIYLLYLSVSSYIASLEGCPEGSTMMWCLGHFGQWEVRILISYLNKSAFVAAIIYILSVKRIFKYVYSIPITVLVYSYLCLYYDTGMDLYYHGGYNRLFFCIFFVIFYILLRIIWYISIKLYNNFYKTISLLITIILLAYAYYLYIIHGSCDYWIYGFKGTKIDNSNSTCVVPIPKICSFTIFDDLVDVARLSKINCADHSQFMYSRDTIIPFTEIKYKNETNIIGYPRTEHWDMQNHTAYGSFQKFVLKLMISMDTDAESEDVKHWSEFKVEFFDENNKEYIKKLNSNDTDKKSLLDEVGNLKKFNATLKLVKEDSIAEEAKEKRKNFNETEVAFENILHIFIDSLSRNHFRRKLPKLYSYLENYYDVDNDSSKEFSSYQFFKFQSLYPGTVANMAPTFFGKYFGNEAVSVLDYYREAGFVTGSTMNYCGREFFDVEPGVNFSAMPVHHELSGLFCDPNLHSLQGPFTFFNGPYSVTKKCLWGKESIEWSIDYAKQFFTEYKDNSKYFRLANIDSHEATGEVIKYSDEKLLNFLKWYEDNGFMKNSLVIIQSDHGFFMPGYIYQYFNFQDYHVEMSMPVLNFLVPKSHKYYKLMNYYLRSNEQNLITAFDLNRCLEEFIRKDTDNWGICPFTDIQDQYDCEYWRIDKEWCRCENLTNGQKSYYETNTLLYNN